MTKLVVLALMLSSQFAVAESEQCKPEDTSKPVRFHTEVFNGKRTVVIEDELIVCPKVPRPAVAYVTSPKNVEFSWQTLDQSFLPKIIESLREAPFGGTR
jgi:hypothetical protein